ncbi:MAG: hypothetical protein ACKO2K_19665 [Alphaproteobacteria bacterium]
MSDRKGSDGLWQRLLGVGEERVGAFVGELLSSPQVADAIGKALSGAARTKGTVDRNMQMVLSTLNVPTRQDLATLTAKVEALQGSLVNLNIKLDRLIAATAAQPSSPGPATTRDVRRPVRRGAPDKRR